MKISRELRDKMTQYALELTKDMLLQVEIARVDRKQGMVTMGVRFVDVGGRELYRWDDLLLDEGAEVTISGIRVSNEADDIKI